MSLNVLTSVSQSWDLYVNGTKTNSFQNEEDAEAAAIEVIETDPTSSVDIKCNKSVSFSAEIKSLTFSPSTWSPKVGDTKQLAVTATFSDGSTGDVSKLVTVSSSYNSILVVDSALKATAVAAGSATLTATYQNQTATLLVTVIAPVTLTSINVTPATASLSVGGTQQLAVTATFSDGSTKDVTSAASYKSSDTTLATVDAAGLVTAVAAGSPSVTVTYNGQTTTCAVTVASASTHTVVVTAQNLAIPGSPVTTFTAQASVGEDQTAPAIIVPLSDSNGNQHPVKCIFYATGVDIDNADVHNQYGFANVGLTVTYDGATVFSQTVQLWRGCRFRYIQYGAPITFSAANIDPTLYPKYPAGPAPAFDISRFTTGFNELGIAQYPNMGAGGDHPGIGYVPSWCIPFLVNRDQASFVVMQTADQGSGIWPIYWHMGDCRIIDITKYPNVTMLPPASIKVAGNPITPLLGTYDGTALATNSNNWKITDCPHSWNEAHETAYNFISAMATRGARDMDHASFWANAILIAFNPNYRATSGIFHHYQERGTAWGLRSLFLAAYVSSDQSYFATQLSNQLQYTTAIMQTNTYGLMATYCRAGANGNYSGIAVWQENFVRMVLDPVWKKLPEWKPFAVFLAQFIATVLATPYAPLWTVYVLTVKDSSGNFLSSIDDMMKTTLLSVGWSQADVDTAVSATVTPSVLYALMQKYNPNWSGKQGDFLQYPATPMCYPALMRVAACAAKNLGVVGGDAAWTYCEQVPTQVDFSANWRGNWVPD